MSKSNNGNWHSFIMVIMRFLICVLWIGSWILFLPSGEIMSKKVKAPKFCSWRKNNHYQAWRLKPYTTPAPGDPNWNHISLCITSSLIHQSWPRMTKIDQGWPKVTKIDKGWQKMTEIELSTLLGGGPSRGSRDVVVVMIVSITCRT